MNAETLLEYDVPLVGNDGLAYAARACGREREDGLWEGWIELEAVGANRVWRTARETTQPNRAGIMYWASGVSAVYLEGALSRAMEPRPVAPVATTPSPPAFDGPRDAVEQVSADAGVVPELDQSAAAEPVLDPFSIFASKGEGVLRRRLDALAAWHLRTIARAHLILPAARIEALRKPELIEAIVGAARGAIDAPSSHP